MAAGRGSGAREAGPPRVRESVRWGDMRRLEPVSRVFGFDRGLCIDRYYIERFLACCGEDVRGRVLEVADDAYTRRFGGDRVSRSDILHLTGTRQSTIIADLTDPDQFADRAFDCIICTQTLPFIYDVRRAARTLHDLLAPGGTLLVTLPGISQISRYDMERWGDYWRFTTCSARRLFEDVFSVEDVQVDAFGNVLVATAFLHGLASDELEPEELDHRDADYELMITVRATRAAGA